jgi:hypothetical protein
VSCNEKRGIACPRADGLLPDAFLQIFATFPYKAVEKQSVASCTELLVEVVLTD